MTVLKVKDKDGNWIPIVSGPQGPTAYVVQPEEPEYVQDLLWMDSDEEYTPSGEVGGGGGGGLDQAAADARYVNIDGDTMTGTLNLPATGLVLNGTSNISNEWGALSISASTGNDLGLQVSGSQRIWFSSGDTQKIDMGDSQLQHVLDPTLPNDAATKGYVDSMPGVPGPMGPPGTAYLSAQWNFNQNTVVSPASGTMRMNATTYAATTQLWVHETDRDGLDRQAGLTLAVAGDQIIMQSAQGRVVWNITAQADSGTYRTFTVTVAESSGNRPSASSPTTLYFTTVGSGSSGGDVLGVWSSTVSYPAGSIVTYGGKTWGAPAAIAAGGAPPTVGSVVTNIPVGSDNFANAPAIAIATDGVSASSVPYSNATYTTETSEPANWAHEKSAWTKYIPATSGTVTFTTVGSTGDSVFAIYVWNGVSPVTFATLSTVASGDDNIGDDASASVAVTGGLTYYIQIGSYLSAVQDYVLNISGARATAALPQPWTKLAVIEGSAILSGLATPTGATGNVSDYYLDTDDRVLYGPKGTGFTPAAPQSVWTNQTPTSSNTFSDHTIGHDITVAVAGRALGLRYWRYSAAQVITTHTLKIWTTAGALLGTCTTTGEAVGLTGWFSGTFTVPVELTAGTYRITVDSPNGDAWAQTSPAGAKVINGDLSHTHASGSGATYYYSSGASGFAFPTNGDTALRPWVDISFESGPPGVSPWPVALKSAPLVGAWGKWTGTQAQYDAVVTKDPDTLYVVI